MTRGVLSAVLVTIGLALAGASLLTGGGRDLRLVAEHAERSGDGLVRTLSGPVRAQAGIEPEGAVVGRFDLACTRTSAPADPAQHREQCALTTTLLGEGGGELYAQGVGREQAPDVVLGVTGGNEAFQGASGQVELDRTRAGETGLAVALAGDGPGLATGLGLLLATAGGAGLAASRRPRVRVQVERDGDEVVLARVRGRERLAERRVRGDDTEGAVLALLELRGTEGAGAEEARALVEALRRM